VKCKGCGSTTRKLSTPGPRCASCHRQVKAARKAAVHEAYVLKTYGLKAGEYQALYEAQGGVCYICQRARGVAKKLSVDHCHRTGLVRGLIDSVCNKMLGHLRDDPEAFERAAEYLRNPPAQIHIGLRKPE
jgi:hypothetical protein